MRRHNYRLDAQRLKESIDPRDFYLHELGLNRLGSPSSSWAVADLCPFHEDKHTGSFKVNLDTGTFKCWACGAKGGDIIAFKMQKDNLTFIEAFCQLERDWEVTSW